jgi:hypothetical protein
MSDLSDGAEAFTTIGSISMVRLGSLFRYHNLLFDGNILTSVVVELEAACCLFDRNSPYSSTNNSSALESNECCAPNTLGSIGLFAEGEEHRVCVWFSELLLTEDAKVTR